MFTHHISRVLVSCPFSYPFFYTLSPALTSIQRASCDLNKLLLQQELCMRSPSWSRYRLHRQSLWEQHDSVLDTQLSNNLTSPFSLTLHFLGMSFLLPIWPLSKLLPSPCLSTFLQLACWPPWLNPPWLGSSVWRLSDTALQSIW